MGNVLIQMDLIDANVFKVGILMNKLGSLLIKMNQRQNKRT